MSKTRWWAVYRGCQYIEHVRAVSGERALDAVSEQTGIPLEELDAVDHDEMERSGLGMLPLFSMELGPEFAEPVLTMRAVPWAQTEARLEARREPGPTMRAVPWAQTEARVSARPDPIPDAGPTPADMRGEVEHD